MLQIAIDNNGLTRTVARHDGQRNAGDKDCLHYVLCDPWWTTQSAYLGCRDRVRILGAMKK